VLLLLLLLLLLPLVVAVAVLPTAVKTALLEGFLLLLLFCWPLPL
jgi:hypothetical protein